MEPAGEGVGGAEEWSPGTIHKVIKAPENLEKAS